MDYLVYSDIERVNKEIKTTDIMGKAYSEVPQRITAFRKLYPEGFIRTRLLSNVDGVAIMQTEVGYYDKDEETELILATGMAYERENNGFINKTSYIENCETSAVGRALGMLGIGIDGSVASAEEVQNAMMQQASAEKIDKTQVTAVKKAISTMEYKEEMICKAYNINSIEEMTIGQLRQFNDRVEKDKKKEREKLKNES